MVGGAMQYGGRTGIWNILEVLDRLNVKATFMVCGTTAEKYPDAVRAAHRAGHEIAGMSYGFDRVRTASFEREQGIVRKTVKVLHDICGATIKGWRCPDYRVSPQTLDVLSAEGFAWDSSLLNDDLPCLFDCAGGPMVELPFTTSTADKTYIGYPYPMRGGPDGLADVWNSEFDVLYRESETTPRFMILSIQTWATGRPAPLRTLRQFIERTSAHNDICFARCGEIADWCGEASRN
jgi:peptidoglycan/xylan/chitin deacetylase (PgdA/CDA1 family)